jgi:hypothetical protein
LADVIYLTDPDTQEVLRRYTDGAAFVAYGQPHPLGFWARHPHVDDFTQSEITPAEVAVRVWTKHRIEDNGEGLLEEGPSRDPDYEFSGPGRMGDAFWARHPDVAHAEVFNHAGDDALDQDFWRVKIWLKGGD